MPSWSPWRSCRRLTGFHLRGPLAGHMSACRPPATEEWTWIDEQIERVRGRDAVDRFRYLPMAEQLVVLDYLLSHLPGFYVGQGSRSPPGPVPLRTRTVMPSCLRVRCRAGGAGRACARPRRSAAGAFRPRTAGPRTLSVSGEPAAEFDEEYSFYEPAVIEVLADEQVVLVVMAGAVLDEQDDARGHAPWSLSDSSQP